MSPHSAFESRPRRTTNGKRMRRLKRANASVATTAKVNAPRHRRRFEPRRLPIERPVGRKPEHPRDRKLRFDRARIRGSQPVRLKKFVRGHAEVADECGGRNLPTV